VAAGAEPGGPTCSAVGDACDPVAASCCANAVCATVAGGAHACAVVAPL
jgi:hypothetical protein